jgi:hypothetical protein
LGIFQFYLETPASEKLVTKIGFPTEITFN